MLLFGVFSLAVSPGTWPGGAWVPGGPCPGFSLLLFSHDPEVAFSIMHQDVSHVSLAQRASPQFENRVQIFTSHLSMMNLQDQVTLTNWPASKKKIHTSVDFAWVGWGLGCLLLLCFCCLVCFDFVTLYLPKAACHGGDVRDDSWLKWHSALLTVLRHSRILADAIELDRQYSHPAPVRWLSRERSM